MVTATLGIPLCRVYAGPSHSPAPKPHLGEVFYWQQMCRHCRSCLLPETNLHLNRALASRTVVNASSRWCDAQIEPISSLHSLTNLPGVPLCKDANSTCNNHPRPSCQVPANVATCPCYCGVTKKAQAVYTGESIVKWCYRLWSGNTCLNTSYMPVLRILLQVVSLTLIIIKSLKMQRILLICDVQATCQVSLFWWNIPSICYVFTCFLHIYCALHYN